MDLIDKACEVLATIQKRKSAYDSINTILRQTQGDFATQIEAMDNDIENAVVKLLDEILGAELASYWLYECSLMPNGGRIEDNGKKWRIKTIRDVKKYARHLAKV